MKICRQIGQMAAQTTASKEVGDVFFSGAKQKTSRNPQHPSGALTLLNTIWAPTSLNSLMLNCCLKIPPRGIRFNQQERIAKIKNL